MKKKKRFKQWRMSRPFWGATLTLLSGLVILWIPVQLTTIAFMPGSLAFIGFLFGGLIIIFGLLGYVYPGLHTLLGILTIFISVLSIMGALGGLLIGTLLGIFGGSLSIAWTTKAVPVKEKEQKTRSKDSKQTEEEVATTKEPIEYLYKR